MKKLPLIVSKGFILFLIISLSGLGILFGYSQIVTYLFLPFLLFYTFNLNKFKTRSSNNVYLKIFLFILFLSLLLLFKSIDISAGLSNISKLAGVFFCIIITFNYLNFKKYNFTNTFLASFIISFYVISFFLILDFGVGVSNISKGENIKRSEFELNANIYSYFSFFANMAIYYLLELTKNKKLILFSIFTTIFGVFISFITASRSGLLFTVLIAFFYWFYIFNLVGAKFKILKYLILALVSIFIVIQFYSVYQNSFIKERVDSSISSGKESRVDLAKEAIYVFSDHPLTGVGPGQFYLYGTNKESFSHNSYTEMAANLGILGLLLVLFLFVKPFLSSIKIFQNKRFKNRSILKLNILFFLFFIIYNNFYVFYLTTYGMIFFMIIVSIQEKTLIKNSIDN